jgi:LPXTG-site transpeptidase (sortase) family protein
MLNRNILSFFVRLLAFAAFVVSTFGRPQPAQAVAAGFSEYYVPGAVDQLMLILNDNDPTVPTTQDLHNVITITIVTDGTSVYYDHWENGYGTGTVGNDEHYVGNRGDVLTFISDNPYPRGSSLTACSGSTFPAGGSPGGDATRCYDGRDRIYVAGGAVSVAQAFWPTTTGTVYANAWSLYPIKPWELNYVIPVGENLAATLTDFTHTYVMAQSQVDGTHVTIDNPGTPGIEVNNVVLNRGEVTELYHIDAGTTVTSDQPVQVQFIVGTSTSFDSRSYTATPSSLWETAYYSPVPSDTGGTDTDLYAYNPGGSSLSVNWADSSGTGSFTVGAGATRSYQDGTGHFVPVDSGAYLSAASVFWAVGSYDTESPLRNWGFSLIPVSNLLDDYYIGWAPGTTDLSANGSPIYVTPTQDNTTVFVDYDNNGTVDATVSLNRLQIAKLRDLSDNDNTGAHVYATHPIAIMWGESAEFAGAGNPYIDAGYTIIPPLPQYIDIVVTMDKTADPDHVSTAVGQTSTFTLVFKTDPSHGLDGVTILDTLPAGWAYVPSSTTITLPDATTIHPDPSISGQDLTWSAFPGVLNMNANETLTVVFQAETTSPQAAGFVTNRAVGSGTIGADTFTADDTAQVYITNLDVQKTSSAGGTTLPGDTITYTVTITNNGAATQNNVVVTDALPAGTTYVPNSTTAVSGATTLDNIPGGVNPDLSDGGPPALVTAADNFDLAPSAVLTVTYQVTVGDPLPLGQTSVVNTAGVSSVEQPEPLEVSVTDVITPELTLDKTIFSGSPYSTVGGTIVYHFLVTNTSNVPLANPVTITDDQTADESCPNTNTVGNNDGFLDPTESITCTASHTVTQADLNAGSLTNHATAHAASTDSNQDQATATATQSPALLLDKTIFSGNPYTTVGGTIVYHYLVTNTGNVRLPNPVTITDDRSSDESCPNTNTVGNLDGFLDPGESITCTASHTVTQSNLNGGAFTNHATAHAGGTDSNQDQATASATQSLALTLDKTIFSGNPYTTVGGTIVYHYLVTNTGNVRRPNPVTITDDQSTDESCPNTNTVGNNDGFLDPTESITCTASHTVTQADLNAGSLTNHATAHVGGTDSNQDQATATTTQGPALLLDKTIFSGSPYTTVGGTIVYHYLVTNTGNVRRPNPVTITDDQSTDESCPNTNTVGNNDGFLDPTESITCTASHTVTQADLDAGSLTNHATAHAGGTDSNEDQATATTPPDLSIIKTADTAYIAADAPITYTIRIQHTSSSQADATDVVITDVLPPEVDYVSGPICNLGTQSPDVECRYDSASRTVIARWSNFTRAGGTGQISIAVRGNRNLACNSRVENAAVVQWNGNSKTSTVTLYASPRAGENGCPRHLPLTGYLPGPLTGLSSLPPAPYRQDSGMSLDIPRLGLGQMAIVGIPLVDGVWDVDSLGGNAGWLETTPLPGQDGNSVISGHVTDIYGADGPFAELSVLAAGDDIWIRASGQVYIYRVQWVTTVAPDDLSVLAADEEPTLTLVTCSSPNYTTHTYDERLVVRAVLVQQSPEQ